MSNVNNSITTQETIGNPVYTYDSIMIDTHTNKMQINIHSSQSIRLTIHWSISCLQTFVSNLFMYKP